MSEVTVEKYFGDINANDGRNKYYKKRQKDTR